MKKLFFTVITAVITSLVLMSCDKKAPEGFVYVKGMSVKKQVAESDVFIDGRTVKIPNLYACDHEVTQEEYEKYCFYRTFLMWGRNYTVGGWGEAEIGKNKPAFSLNWYDAIVYCNLRSMDEGLTPVYAIYGITDPKKWPNIYVSEKNEDYTHEKKGMCMLACVYNSEYFDSYIVPYQSFEEVSYYLDITPDDLEAKKKTWDIVTCNFSANGYRLPTEAEWEYLARGGKKLENFKYSGSDDAESVAWTEGCTGDGVREVKTKMPNSLGIYDMSGSMAEWCWDWYDEITEKTPVSGSQDIHKERIVRGGSGDVLVTVPERNGYDPYRAFWGIGFRVVRTVK